MLKIHFNMHLMKFPRIQGISITNNIRMVWLGCAMCCLLMINNELLGQPISWTSPNPALYTHTASAVAILQHDGLASNNINDRIAFFVGGQLQGLSVPVDIPGLGTIHFITLYANQGSEEMSVEVYHASDNQVYPAVTTFTFVAQSITGTLDIPHVIYSFSDDDAPVGLLPFPARTGVSGITLPPLDLEDFLVQLDEDPVVWSYVPNPDLDVQIVGSVLLITPLQTFTGQTDLEITVTEQTVNAKFATGLMPLTIEVQPAAPNLSTIPGEGILLQEEFSTFDLNDFIIPPVPPCVTFDFYPEITVSAPPTSQPQWQFSGYFKNNMIIVARPVYTPGYIFQHPDDRLVAYVNGSIKGVASPTIIAGEVYYFLTVAGGSLVKPMTIKFYSGHMRKIFMSDNLGNYVPYLNRGSIDQPFLMDFSPITPLLGNDGNVEMVINDTTWTGSQIFHFIAKDCLYPVFIADTSSATFCIQQNNSGYTTLYRDFDEDGFGDPEYSVQICGSTLQGWVTNPDDCFDSPARVTCPYFPSLDVPKPIDFNIPDTITSEIVIPDFGSITGIKVNNLRIDHTYIGDLRIKLRSPANTEVVLFDQRCGALPDLLLDFDSESTHLYTDIPCPPVGGFCYKPLEDLSIFHGENLSGTWTLIVEDLAFGDGGALQSWGLQICYGSCPELGQINTYTGGSGSWDEASRWSLGHPANACEHAIIDLNNQSGVVQILPQSQIQIYRLTVAKGILVVPSSSTLEVKE